MKKTLLTLIILTLTTAVFALPGFNPYVPDTAGEYVYYRDYSFARESYVGILNYDDTSYQIRYYAPASREQVAPEKDLAILFTVNPEEEFFNLTGERILGQLDPSTEDDIDILNYMHDILYELSARRIKEGDIGSQAVNSTQDYDQFGGKVTLCYDSLIPLFNLKNIRGADGSLIFSCITFGRIVNAEDTSFEAFKGLVPAKPYHAPAKNKNKAKAKKFETVEGQKITLDTNWEQALDNCWVYGDDAFLTIATVPTYFEDRSINDIFVLRRITESTGGSYIDFENIEITVDSKKHLTKVTAKASQPENAKIVYIIKELTTNPDKPTSSYVSLAAYEDSYLEKSNYYTKLLKSFKD